MYGRIPKHAFYLSIALKFDVQVLAECRGPFGRLGVAALLANPDRQNIAPPHPQPLGVGEDESG